MSKKLILAGVGVMGCVGMFLVVLLIGGGIIAVAAMDSDPAPVAEGPRAPTPGPDAPAEPDAPVEPEEEEAVSETVTLEGRIVDAATQQGIGGAYFVLLTPGKTYADFQASSDPRGDGILEVGAITDSDGNFRLSDVRRGYSYTIISAADGYEIGHADNALEINNGDPEVTRLNPISLPRE